MAIEKEFYFYQSPFFFPNYFITYKNKYDLEKLIESFSQVELEKIFPVETFLNQFSVFNKDPTSSYVN